MKGFKNTTRTQYSMGGDVGGYAKGGMAKGAAKISKVMGEFKKGELHSGSKDGPKVTKPAQAKAIAMSEARKAGMKAPMKKNEGGKVGKMPPLGETMKSVRRLPPELTPEQMRALEDRFAEKKRPSLGETMESVRRLPKELTPAQMRALEEGSKVRKYAVGGPAAPVKKKALPTYNASAAYQQFGADLKRMIDSGQLTLKQANALKAPAFEATRLRDVGQQQQAMDAALAAARGRMVPPVAQPQMMQPPMKVPEMPAPMYGDGPLRPTTAQLSEYNAGGRKGAWDPVSGVFTTSPPPPPPRKIYEPQRPPVPPPIESIGPTPPPVVAPTRQVIGYRSPPPGMSAADLANFDTRIYAQPEMPMPDTALGMFDYSSPASSPDMNDSIRGLLRSYDKYAATGKYDMPDLRNFVNDLSSQFTDNDRIAAKSSLLNNLPMRGMGNVQTPEQLQQIEARKKAYGEHSRREAQYRQEQFDAQMRARQADLRPPPTPLPPKLMEPPPMQTYTPPMKVYYDPYLPDRAPRQPGLGSIGSGLRDLAVKQPPMGRPEMPADFGHLPPGVPGFEQQYAQPVRPPPEMSVGVGMPAQPPMMQPPPMVQPPPMTPPPPQMPVPENFSVSDDFRRNMLHLRPGDPLPSGGIGAPNRAPSPALQRTGPAAPAGPVAPPPPMPGFRMGGMAKRRPY